jgi:hypothetical protein
LWRIDPLLGNDSVNTFPPKANAHNNRCLLLGSGSVNTPETIRDNRRRCFPWGPCKVVINNNSIEQHRVSCQELSRVSRCQPARIWAWEQRNWNESSRNWQLQNNDKKAIRLWKENFVCGLKWQEDGYKSVARVRLMKTENPSACVTVNCKVCKSPIALYCLLAQTVWMYKVK